MIYTKIFRREIKKKMFHESNLYLLIRSKQKFSGNP